MANQHTGKIPIQTRFWSKVNKAGPVPSHRPELGPCWIWTASLTHGYGQLQSRDGTCRRSHRLSWEWTNGPIPDGMCVMHKCDERRCVRPDHLEVGSVGDNNRDMARKGRARSPALRGEAHGQSVLTENDIRAIRVLRALGVDLPWIASMFETPASHVWAIDRRRSWAHVP